MQKVRQHKIQRALAKHETLNVWQRIFKQQNEEANTNY